MSARVSVSECVSLSGGLHPYRLRLRSSDVAPLGPLITRGGRQSSREHGSDIGRESTTLIKGKLIYRCLVRCCEVGSSCLSHSRTLSLNPTHQSLTRSSGQSPTHTLAQPVTYLTDPSHTYCVTTQTRNSIKQSVNAVLSTRQKRKETALCLQQVLHLIFLLMRSSLLKLKFVSVTHQSSISLAIKASRIMWLQCVGMRILNLSTGSTNGSC